MLITPIYPDTTEANALHKKQIDTMLANYKRTAGPTPHTLSQQRDAEHLRALQKQSEHSRMRNRAEGS